jgi:hypothetical protein
MSEYQYVKFCELPQKMREQLNEKDVFKSLALLNFPCFIVWVNPHNKKYKYQMELEWDDVNSKFLSNEERLKRCDNSYSITLLDHGIKASRVYYINSESDGLCERFYVYDIKTNKQLFEVSQSLYKIDPQSAEKLILSKLKEFNFPKEYAGWEDKKKIDYWVGIWYRARRQAGECGYDENDALDAELVRRMHEIDPDVDRLFPFIIYKRATFDFADPAEMAEAFSRQTGIMVDISVVNPADLVLKVSPRGVDKSQKSHLGKFIENLVSFFRI